MCLGRNKEAVDNLFIICMLSENQAHWKGKWDAFFSEQTSIQFLITLFCTALATAQLFRPSCEPFYLNFRTQRP